MDKEIKVILEDLLYWDTCPDEYKETIKRHLAIEPQDKATKELLDLFSVSNWVAIESDEQPERVTDVMVKYMDGVKEVALFDGDGRYYIEKDDRDVTDRIVEWHRLP